MRTARTVSQLGVSYPIVCLFLKLKSLKSKSRVITEDHFVISAQRYYVHGSLFKFKGFKALVFFYSDGTPLLLMLQRQVDWHYFLECFESNDISAPRDVSYLVGFATGEAFLLLRKEQLT